MYEPAFNRAMLPLLESGDIDALEWSFDTIADHRVLPDWMQSLLGAYSDEERLYAHGVYYSLFGGSWGTRHTQWLDNWRHVQEAYYFRHISEHFGFMTSRHAHHGCPLPVPLNNASVQLGSQRLAALQEASKCPVGVENLALAFSKGQAQSHGDFLQQLVAPIGGFVVLDMHNIYCQSVNFNLDMKTLICSYPLERVREIHLSGGSWADSNYQNTPVRRDTHDDGIPAEVLNQLSFAIQSCPNLDLVIIERLGDTLQSLQDEALFRDEFLMVKSIVREAANHVVPGWPYSITGVIIDDLHVDAALNLQQQQILNILSKATSAEEARQQLSATPELAEWQVDQWSLPMLDTAIQLGRRWGIELEVID
jgi:uncharacterized protein (UPF0276 family)